MKIALSLVLFFLPSILGCSFVTARSTPKTAAYAEVRTYEDHRARMKSFETDAGSLAYLDEGQGIPVVLIHGIPTSSWLYRKVAVQLIDRGYRVIAPDLMGMGASARTEDVTQLTVAAQAGYLNELLAEELGLEDWIHVVHDFGGPITWEMMEDERFKIRRLVLLDTFAFERGWTPELNGITKAAMKLGTMEPFNLAFYEIAVRGMVSREATATDDMLGGYCQPLVEGADLAYKCLYFSSNEVKAELPRYQRTLETYRGGDVHLCWGRGDEFLSADDQVDQLVRLLEIDAGNLAVLDDVGHLVPEEAPDQVVEAIVRERLLPAQE